MAKNAVINLHEIDPSFPYNQVLRINVDVEDMGSYNLLTTNIQIGYTGVDPVYPSYEYIVSNDSTTIIENISDQQAAELDNPPFNDGFIRVSLEITKGEPK